MKRFLFITGDSYGLGKALRNKYLDRSFGVVGCSRSNPHYTHPLYQHVYVDLSQSSSLSSFTDQFSRADVLGSEEVYLIHNAAVIDPVARFESTNLNEVRRALEINMMSVLSITQAFLKNPKLASKKRHVVFITSGLASRTLPGLSTYGMSKAALEIFSKYLHDEHSTDPTLRFVCLRPGTVDTPMQARGREEATTNVPELTFFREIQAQGLLKTPEQTAEEIFEFLESPDASSGNVYAIRDGLWSKVL